MNNGCQKSNGCNADKERGEEKNIITAYMHEPSLKTGT